MNMLIMGPVISAIVVFLGSLAIDYFVVKRDVEKLSISELHSKAAALGYASMVQGQSLNRLNEAMNNNYDVLYDAIESGDQKRIAQILDWVKDVTKLTAFILTDLDGNVICASQSNINEETLSNILEAVAERGHIEGTDPIFDDQNCSFSADYVKNNDGTPIAVFLPIGTNTSVKGQMSVNLEVEGSHTYMFTRERCVNATYDVDDLASIKTPQEIVDSCFTAGKVLSAELKIEGDEGYFLCTPLRSYTGEVTIVAAVYSFEEQTDAIVARQGTVFVVCSIIALMVTTLLFWLILSRLIRPVKKFVRDLHPIAKGDFRQDIEMKHSCNEMIEICSSVQQMKTDIRNVLIPIMKKADYALQGTEKLSESSNIVSEASSTQAASLEEISSTMEEMNSNSEQNSFNAKNANELAKSIGQEIKIIGEASASSYESIQQIAENIQDINALVRQTNILSLNASVEAARAGEQGRGFAVVAHEVGRLADQTYQTADGITRNANSSIEEVHATNDRIKEIAPKIQQIVAQMNEITAASIEQNSGSAQVNSVIVELNRTTQENAASAEEMASRTADIKRVINEMVEAIRVFKV